MKSAAFPSFISRSAEETERFARALSLAVGPGMLIALNGPLGAGKTLVASALGEALGARGVKSPTFAIERIHHLPTLGIDLVHADLYRLDDVSAETMSIDERIDDGDAAIVEWADRVEGWREPRIEITITPSGDGRVIDMKAFGDAADAASHAFCEACAR